MTPSDLRNIRTTRNSCKDTLLWVNMALKLLWYFYLLMELSLLVATSKFGLLTIRQHSATIKHLFLDTHGDRQVWESQKRISINTNHSYHQRSSLLASLNWSNNKVRFSFNQPNRKRLGAKLVNVKCLPHKAFVLWQKGWSTKAKEAHPPREVRLTLLDTNPVF